MSKSHNKIKTLKLNTNIRKKNKLLVSNYSKKMFIFYKPLLKTLEKESNLAQYFSIKENSITHNFVTCIYSQFIQYNNLINSLNITNTRTSTNNVSEKINAIVKDHLSKSKYIDSSIITYISANISNCKLISYENTINSKKFVLNFIIYDKVNINNLDNIAKNMLLFIQVLIKISKNLNNEINICSNDGVSITFFMTPFLKKLNIPNNTTNEILGANNVNSGFAYICLASGSIFIYRKQDFFKVFVHEIVHAYGIDKALHSNFSKNENYNKFLNMFAFANKDITNVGINEAITEFWTSLLYLCINSYQVSESLQDYIYNFKRLYKMELLHALYQISKILHYNKLTYNSFINNSNSKYSENSHIFSYFIVKTLMLINNEHMLNSQLFDLNSIYKLEAIKNNSFINIKLKNDTTTINKLFANLYDYANDPIFIKLISNIEAEHLKHYNKYVNKYVNKYANNKTQKINKNIKLETRKNLTYKNKKQDRFNIENFMLTNLKMMIYDYNI
jgi:hypothetical protein